MELINATIKFKNIKESQFEKIIEYLEDNYSMNFDVKTEELGITEPDPFDEWNDRRMEEEYKNGRKRIN